MSWIWIPHCLWGPVGEAGHPALIEAASFGHVDKQAQGGGLNNAGNAHEDCQSRGDHIWGKDQSALINTSRWINSMGVEHVGGEEPANDRSPYGGVVRQPVMGIIAGEIERDRCAGHFSGCLEGVGHFGRGEGITVAIG